MKLLGLLIAAAFCAATVATSIGQGVGSRPILADDQFTFFMAERAASGVPPHTAQMEVKTQLPTLVHAAAIRIGRAFGVDDIPAGRAVGVTAAALLVLLGWRLALQLSSNPVTSLIAGVAVFGIHGVFIEAATGFQPKLVLIPFLLSAHLFCARRQWMLSGAAAACTFLCWQPGGIVLASCLFALLLDRHSSWRDLLRFAGGAALVMFCYEAWFLLNGAIREQLWQEWVLAFGAQHKDKGLRESLWFFLTESRGYLPRPHVLPVLFFTAMALLWLRVLATPRRSFAALRSEPGLVAFWTAAHLTTAFTLYDHQAHPDMLFPQAYFGVALALVVAAIVAPFARWRLAMPLGLLSLAALAAFVWRDARIDMRRSLLARGGLERQYEQAKLLSMYKDHRGSLYAMGPLHLLALNHWDNWLPIGNVGHESREFDMKTWRPLRDGKMPEIIVTSRGLRPGAGSWLPAEYVDITPPLLALDRIRVFSRRMGPGSGFEKHDAPKPAKGPK